MWINRMTQEFDFYSLADFSEYSGKWVAILGNKVIADGDDLKKVYEKAKKISGKKEPMFVPIPKQEEALIL
jgi:hypothetical protein